MHSQTCRFVNDQHKAIAMEHAGLDFFRCQLGNFESPVKTFVHGPKPLTHRP
jgi:hypothetical protein